MLNFRRIGLTFLAGMLLAFNFVHWGWFPDTTEGRLLAAAGAWVIWYALSFAFIDWK